MCSYVLWYRIGMAHAVGSVCRLISTKNGSHAPISQSNWIYMPACWLVDRVAAPVITHDYLSLTQVRSTQHPYAGTH